MELTESHLAVFPTALLSRFEFREIRNAAAVLSTTNPQAFRELCSVLEGFTLTTEDVLQPGRNEGSVAKKLNRAFREKGWREGRYDTRLTSQLRLMPYRPAGEKRAQLSESEITSLGYKVDNVKGEVALDVEWNAKDGNLDRDIGAYRAFYSGGMIAVGVLITRTMTDLRNLGLRLGRPDFLKTSTTTNLGKLEPRLTRGDAGGCPVLAIAITARCFQGGDLLDD